MFPPKQENRKEVIAKMDDKKEIYHHGVLGQKWGVRRYQNIDGSLTDAGQRRYKHLNNMSTDEISKRTLDAQRRTKAIADYKKVYKSSKQSRQERRQTRRDARSDKTISRMKKTSEVFDKRGSQSDAVGQGLNYFSLAVDKIPLKKVGDKAPRGQTVAAGILGTAGNAMRGIGQFQNAISLGVAARYKIAERSRIR